MLHDLPVYIPVIFALTTIATLLFFYWIIKNASTETVRKRSGIDLAILITWLILQAIMAIKNVYNSNTDSIPPKILLLGVAPAILTIIFLFVSSEGRRFIDSLSLKSIT